MLYVSKVIEMKRVVLITLAVLSMTPSPACMFFNPGVHFILPDGYIGAFRIILDEGHGIDVKVEGGRYIYRIPENGELKVKSFEPFMKTHKETAAYRSGKEIPRVDSTVKLDVIALRGGMGSGSREVNGKNVGPVILTYVIGTREQENSLKSPTFTDKVQNVNSTPQP
jgi:hypothetical protein